MSLMESARRLLRSRWFDAEWYRQRYPDVPGEPLDQAAHYLVHGAGEGRDPGPKFSTTGYQLRYPRLERVPGRPDTANPVLRHEALGRFLGRRPLPRFDGARTWQRGAPALLVCAHRADAHIYGAERSLLDLLGALERLSLNVVVTLPAAGNEDYLARVRAHCAAVHVLPYAWWHAEREACPATIEAFARLIRRYRVGLVHANTLVLDEPLQAALACGVPGLVHVRELPWHDSALCDALGADAARVLARVQEHATAVIANSQTVARTLPSGSATISVVPNAVDPGNLPACDPPGGHTGLRVGMLSSNLPKKGLEDMAALADRLAQLLPDARCMLFGPRTQALDRLRARRLTPPGGDNLVVGGYVKDPAEAMEQLDVVVNLSSFQESFGRTVLEAMLAGRPVVAYDWGALPELVTHGKTGYTVPLGDVEAVAACLVELDGDRDRLRQLGLTGRERALQQYTLPAMAERLRAVYSGLQIEC